MSAIDAREAQIKTILELNEQLKSESGDKEALTQLISQELLKLRQDSIRVVELVVLWRD
jgi:hypothetical protein